MENPVVNFALYYLRLGQEEMNKYIYINRETTEVQILYLQINHSHRTKEKSGKMMGMIYGQKMEV